MHRLFALALIALVIAGCTEAPGPIAVTSVAPADGATEVPVNAPITARFDGDVDPASLLGSFTVYRGDAEVPGTVSYNRNLRVARFEPSAPLTPGSYRARVESGIRGVVAGPLPTGVDWRFDMVAVPPPPPVTAPDPSPLPDLAFLAPAPGKRTAGLLEILLDLDAPRGILRADLYLASDIGAVRLERLDVDQDAAPVVRGTLSTVISTFDVEAGPYTLRGVLEDREGNVVEQEIGVVFLTPFVITTPTEGEGVGSGNGRQIVALTVGVNGTIRDDYDVTSVDIFVNGRLHVAGVPVDDDATSTRLVVYPWDTAVTVTPGHDAEVSGDRVLTARVSFVDPVDGAPRSEFTPGVLVDYQP